MTKLISVITAIQASDAHFLPDTYTSLLAQELPEDWDWQWIIQEDGETDAVAPHVPDDSRVSFAQGRAGRAAMARTLALSRADGEYIKVLDANGMLTQGALSRDLSALTTKEVSWATSRVLDLLPDGSTVGSDEAPPEGVLKHGFALEHWKAQDHRAPVHPGTLFMQRDLVLALGGWMALPASEDTGLLLALNSISLGWFTGEAGLVSRTSSAGSSQAEPVHEREKEARAAIVEARARALAKVHWWRF